MLGGLASLANEIELLLCAAGEKMDNNQRLYNSRAKTYADEWYPNNTMLPTIKDFLGIIDKPKPRILDLGCGPGNESMRLHDQGAEIVGIDFSNECIKIAKERNPEITFYEMNYFDIDDSIGMFDGIFACSSLIHLNEQNLEAVLDILKNILKTHGYIMDLFMLGEGPRTTFPKIGNEEVERVCERRQPEKLNELYNKKGFRYVKNAKIDVSIAETWRASIYQYI